MPRMVRVSWLSSVVQECDGTRETGDAAGQAECCRQDTECHSDHQQAAGDAETQGAYISDLCFHLELSMSTWCSRLI